MLTPLLSLIHVVVPVGAAARALRERPQAASTGSTKRERQARHRFAMAPR